jgi:hypothetical protein
VSVAKACLTIELTPYDLGRAFVEPFIGGINAVSSEQLFAEPNNGLRNDFSGNRALFQM